MKTEPMKLVTVEWGLPTFGGGSEGPSEARLHLDHYNRLEAIRIAAEGGNRLLLSLALAHQRRFGTGPEEHCEVFGSSGGTGGYKVAG